LNKYTDIVKKIHESPFKITFVSSGGGTNAISSLLEVPGASNTILESYIPYSKDSMDKFLNRRPDHYCSLDTCLSMGANAYKNLKKLILRLNLNIYWVYRLLQILQQLMQKKEITNFLLLFRQMITLNI